jgi:hypothetical protein
MLYTGKPGMPTHELGNTIDLVFSNIPFVETVVSEDLLVVLLSRYPPHHFPNRGRCASHGPQVDN